MHGSTLRRRERLQPKAEIAFGSEGDHGELSLCTGSCLTLRVYNEERKSAGNRTISRNILGFDALTEGLIAAERFVTSVIAAICAI
jgi:hypothetical protein